MRKPRMRSAVVVVALLASTSAGCALRRCHEQPLHMYWADGTVTTWAITVCRW